MSSDFFSFREPAAGSRELSPLIATRAVCPVPCPPPPSSGSPAEQSVSCCCQAWTSHPLPPPCCVLASRWGARAPHPQILGPFFMMPPPSFLGQREHSLQLPPHGMREDLGPTFVTAPMLGPAPTILCETQDLGAEGGDVSEHLEKPSVNIALSPQG
jgi:hypothetical protein